MTDETTARPPRRPRGTATAVLAAALGGMRDVLEPQRRDQTVQIQPAPVRGDDSDLVVELDWDDPAASIVRVRPGVT
jgi:hypothetical protein